MMMTTATTTNSIMTTGMWDYLIVSAILGIWLFWYLTDRTIVKSELFDIFVELMYLITTFGFLGFLVVEHLT